LSILIKLQKTGKKVFLPGYDGIDIVGNTLEAVDISFNPDYYSPVGYHNEGHVIIGLSGDPNYVRKVRISINAAI
jgi:hypothetical protein